MDQTPVTNAQFACFAGETGYVTLCEQASDAADYPEADPRLLQAASAVFVPPSGPVELSDA